MADTRSLVISVGGASSSSSESQADLFNLWPYERLQEYVTSTIQSNKVIKAETDMFAYYYTKFEIAKLQTGETGNKNAHGSSQSQSRSSHSFDQFRPGSKAARSHTKTAGYHHFEKLLKLKADDKCELAHKEFDRLKGVQRKRIDEAEREVDHLKAIIEEMTEQAADIKKESYEFDRDVIKYSKRKGIKQNCAEKIIRFFDEKMKFREACIGKLRLKVQSQRLENKRLSQVVRNKEEIGDILTEIDFQQLKIENVDRLEKIDERNRDFFRLKTNGTVVSHTYNHFKRKLERTLRESTQLKQEIASRNALVSRLDSETKYCEMDRSKAEAINKKHRLQLAIYKVPEVMDAVHLHADIVTLTKNVAIWERKNQIAEMALASVKKQWTKMKTEAVASNDDFFADLNNK